VRSIISTLVAPDGQQVSFNLYQAINSRNQPGQCVFGGMFAVT
jgi:hypothetical protein